MIDIITTIAMAAISTAPYQAPPMQQQYVPQNQNQPQYQVQQQPQYQLQNQNQQYQPQNQNQQQNQNRMNQNQPQPQYQPQNQNQPQNQMQQQPQNQNRMNQNQMAPRQQQPQLELSDAQRQAAADAALAYLGLIDKGQYGQSWDAGSDLFHLKMPKDSWIKILEKNRQPLGNTISRNMMDKAILSVDPENLPPGQYLVLFFNTTFSNRPYGVEIVYLRNENGAWKVINYNTTTQPQGQ